MNKLPDKFTVTGLNHYAVISNPYYLTPKIREILSSHTFSPNIRFWREKYSFFKRQYGIQYGLKGYLMNDNGQYQNKNLNLMIKFYLLNDDSSGATYKIRYFFNTKRYLNEKKEIFSLEEAEALAFL